MVERKKPKDLETAIKMMFEEFRKKSSTYHDCNKCKCCKNINGRKEIAIWPYIQNE